MYFRSKTLIIYISLHPIAAASHGLKISQSSNDPTDSYTVMADVVQRSAMGEGECIVDEFAKFITHIAYNLFYNNVRIPHHLDNDEKLF